jgi:hypothetical protein
MWEKIVIDIFVGGSVVNFLVPVSILTIKPFSEISSWAINFAISINVIFYILSTSIALYYVKHKIGFFKYMTLTISFALYFVLHTVAAYIALYQLIKEPFKWNKTPHGISNTKFFSNWTNT